MGSLRLTSIGFDELRTLFAGSPEVEATLRAVAAQEFPPPATPQRRRGLIGAVGGLTRVQPGAPAVPPEQPTGVDIANLTHGRFITADRLPAAWTLIDLWLDATGWPTLALQIDEPQINDLDFELATGGVPVRLSLRALLNDALAVPVGRLPGQSTGLVDGAHAHAMRDAWRTALPTLSPMNGATAQQVVAWLGGLEEWERFAASQGRPSPDLIARFVRGPVAAS